MIEERQIRAIRFRLDRHQRIRDRVPFDLAIESELRGCDVVEIRMGDVVSGGRVRDRAILIQQKTMLPVQVELMEILRKIVRTRIERRDGTH